MLFTAIYGIVLHKNSQDKVISMNNNVMIAMSGGVDSSVAACLMQQQGYRCMGATMLLCGKQLLGSAADSTGQIRDAQNVAERLGIPFHVFDATELFLEKVVSDFVSCYEAGLTPNPCIQCNRHLKFSHLLQKALECGCDYVATGHYARIRQDSDTGRYLLYKAADPAKDQSYFLACLSQEQLCHVKFPLGELTKAQARELAETMGLLNAKKRDSQDICFIPDGDYAAFLRRFTGKGYPSGDFLDQSGKKVGTHSGAVDYTLGQRKRLGLAMGQPVYVCAKDMTQNTVTVGPNEALFATTLLADRWNWFPFPALNAPIEVTAKARSRHNPQPATVYPEADGKVRVVFHEPQRALTPGQAIVLYDGDLVVGGGTITQVL